MGRRRTTARTIRHTHIVSASNANGVKDIFNFTPKADLKTEIKVRLKQYGDDWTYNVRELDEADKVRTKGVFRGEPGTYYYEFSGDGG